MKKLKRRRIYLGSQFKGPFFSAWLCCFRVHGKGNCCDSDSGIVWQRLRTAWQVGWREGKGQALGITFQGILPVTHLFQLEPLTVCHFPK